jgi:membrane peptidoglycan carboxypeptidase/gas vesicle protein
MHAQADRIGPAVAPMATRLRGIAAAAGPKLQQAAVESGTRLQSAASDTGVRLQQVAAVTSERLQQAASETGERLQQAASETSERLLQAATEVKPMARAAEPHAKGLAAMVSQGASNVGPLMSRGIEAVRYQADAGRDARATPRVLRDSQGRRLRASAYVYGPDVARHSRRRPRPGARQVAGSALPAAVKVAIVALIAGLGFLGSSSAYINYAADLPDAHVITSQPLDEDTMIYAADGSLLADLRCIKEICGKDEPQHYYQPLDQTGKWLPMATIAVEDSGFWNEPGIDIFAMGRAAYVDWRHKDAVQGASTITQQLVKLRLTSNAPTIERKIKEAVLALQVEHTYTKRQILEQYLNAVDYSNNARGSLAAARIYFHKESKDLDLAQASMLAGIPQSPRFNSPITNWDGARKRQQAVLDAMVRTHKITQEQADEAHAEDISPPNHMFRPLPQVLAAPGFVSWIANQLAGKYGTQAVYAGGLSVRTTLNMQVQRLAEQAVVDGVNAARWRGASQGAMTAIDPRTGDVLAMVGSANYDQSQYNMAVQPRQPGSSFKIFDYTAAIESGQFTMSTKIPDTPVSVRLPPGSVPNPWSPPNYDHKFHGICQLQQCFLNSLNTPAVKTALTIGIDKVVDVARRMGAPPYVDHKQEDGSVTYSNDDPVTPANFPPPTAIGARYETTLQMATAAATLGSLGTYHQPTGIVSVQSSDGTEIFHSDPNKGSRQAVDPKVAFIMAQTMSNDQNRKLIFGLNSILTLPDRRVAVKTGTTDDFVDAWTVGFTPSIASAFWFGNVDYSAMRYGLGDSFSVASPAWHQFMQSALDAMNTSKNEWFAEPPGLGHATVDGLPVWLLPGTRADQPRPPLPPNVSEGAVKDCSKPPDNGNNNPPPPKPADCPPSN